MQGEQKVIPEVEAVPPEQLLHAVEPVISMYLPGIQAEQAELPKTSDDLPASQSVH